MFPESEGQPRTAKKTWLTSKKTIVLLASGIVVCVLALFGMLVATGMLGGSTVKVPDTITQKVKSPIYLPSDLPGNYKISEKSFDLVEDDAVLVFEATDDTGSKLIFSEQPRPKDFDFDNFYKGQFENAKALSNVPYSSTWGKSIDGRIALSVVTNDTWMMLVTSAPLGEGDMLRIAQGMHLR